MIKRFIKWYRNRKKTPWNKSGWKVIDSKEAEKIEYKTIDPYEDYDRRQEFDLICKNCGYDNSKEKEGTVWYCLVNHNFSACMKCNNCNTYSSEGMWTVFIHKETGEETRNPVNKYPSRIKATAFNVSELEKLLITEEDS